MKSKVIFIEGVDRSGKGSLMQAIHKATNYKHVIFDRGPISNMVYSAVYGRTNEEVQREYEEIEEQLCNVNHVGIYIHCETSELIRRMKETNHEHVDFDLHKELFESFIGTSPLNFVKVDSTNSSPEKIVNFLINKGVL